MRLLVCGGRDYSNREALFSFMDLIKPSVVIQGGATGADRLAAEWATEKDVYLITFEASWSEFGKSAGPRRNRRMLTEGKPDLVAAFPGGAGTEDMIKAALDARVMVMRVVPK